MFAPQKGATPAQVDMLRGRLERLAQMYQEQYGVDVRDIPGSGAAGGLAGGLVALGGRLLPGFDLVADEVDLHDHVARGRSRHHRRGLPRRAELRGQGRRRGAGDVRRRRPARRRGRRRQRAGGAQPHPPSFARRTSSGCERAMHEPLWCIEQAAADLLRQLLRDSPSRTFAGLGSRACPTILPRPLADLAIVNCTALLGVTADRTTFAPGTTIEITGGRFTRIDPTPDGSARAREVIDARGMVAMPGPDQHPLPRGDDVPARRRRGRRRRALVQRLHLADGGERRRARRVPGHAAWPPPR